MTLPNRNLKTGIRYGCISANSLDPDVVDTLLYGPQAKDLSYQQCVDRIQAELEREADIIEEEALIGLSEVDYAMRYNEDAQEAAIEGAYERLGYDDRADFLETRMEREHDFIQIDEPIIAGELDGVKYQTSWLGGALNVWALESPVTGRYTECSPCAPGAGNLDCPDPGGVLTYDMPVDWRIEE